MSHTTRKKGKIIWRSDEQRVCILISIEGKTHQVALNKEAQKNIAFILPQFFKDGMVNILPDELPIILPK